MKRTKKKNQVGQNVVIFALFLVFILVAVGLAIDAGVGYLSSDGAERAAAAAAISGVPYLPGDPVEAVAEAQAAAAQNGFIGGFNGVTSVTAVQVAGSTNQLKVVITGTSSTSFLRLFGFTSTRYTRTATAEYLRPIQLGQSGTAQGSDLTDLGSGGNNFYFLRTEAWGTPRSEGDAFTPDPSNPGGVYPSATDVHQISPAAGTEMANAYTPNRGGYNYLVYVAPGDSVDLQVFNPGFGDDATNNLYNVSYAEKDTTFNNGDPKQFPVMSYTVYPVNTVFDHRSESPRSSIYFRGVDPVAGHYVDPSTGTFFPFSSGLPYYWHKWVSVSNNSVPGAPESNSALPSPGPLLGGASGAYYRLEVDNLDTNYNPPGTQAPAADPSTKYTYSSSGGAHKGYAVQLCETGTGLPSEPPCASPAAGGTVSAVGDMAFYTPIQSSSSSTVSCGSQTAVHGGTFQIQLFGVDKSYAGRQVSVSIFDPGDVGAPAACMDIYEPGTTTAVPISSVTNTGPSYAGGTTCPNPAPTGVDAPSTTVAHIVTHDGGSTFFNGCWVKFIVDIPNNYNPVGVGYFTLNYTLAGGGAAFDTVTVAAAAVGSPVHLLP